MSSGFGFVITSGDHHYDGTRYFTSPRPGDPSLGEVEGFPPRALQGSGAPTPRDSPSEGVMLDQIGGGTIQITENGSVALIPLLKAAGLEIPQLPTDPALRVRTLHAMWIAVLGILSKKGRAGPEAKNRSIEVPRIVQMNPETLAKFRALRVEVVGGRPVRVPTGRNTLAPSDDLDDSESSRAPLIVDPIDTANYAGNPGFDDRPPPWGVPPDSSRTTSWKSILDESTPPLGGVRELQVRIPTPTSRPHTKQGDSRDPEPSMTRPINQSTLRNEEVNLASSAKQSKVYYDEVKWDPALSTSDQPIIPPSTTNAGSLTRTPVARGTIVGPPPGFQTTPGLRGVPAAPENGGPPSPRGGWGAGAVRGVSEIIPGPQYRILQRKKPEEELKMENSRSNPVAPENGGPPSPRGGWGTGAVRDACVPGASDNTHGGSPSVLGSRTGAETPSEEGTEFVQALNLSERGLSTVRADGWGSEGAKTSPMSDTQLGRQVLEYIKSQSNGQLEGRAIGAVAKNIYNSYREVAVHKSRDPNLLNRIEKVIVQLGQSNQIQLGINGKRFPIQIPSNLHPPRGEHLRHRFLAGELEQIYREHREGLSQVNSFNAAARILANSSNRWKQLDRNVAEQLAAAAVAQLIESNLFR